MRPFTIGGKNRMNPRTMEKIKLRAKMSSIVAALDAKEKLELQSYAAPIKRAENYYEAEDLSGLKKNLDCMFNVQAGLLSKVNGASEAKDPGAEYRGAFVCFCLSSRPTVAKDA